MDQEIVILNEVSQTKKEKYVWHSLYVDFYKEMIQINLSSPKTALRQILLSSPYEMRTLII